MEKTKGFLNELFGDACLFAMGILLVYLSTYSLILPVFKDFNSIFCNNYGEEILLCKLKIYENILILPEPNIFLVSVITLLFTVVVFLRKGNPFWYLLRVVALLVGSLLVWHFTSHFLTVHLVHWYLGSFSRMMAALFENPSTTLSFVLIPNFLLPMVVITLSLLFVQIFVLFMERTGKLFKKHYLIEVDEKG